MFQFKGCRCLLEMRQPCSLQSPCSLATWHSHLLQEIHLGWKTGKDALGWKNGGRRFWGVKHFRDDGFGIRQIQLAFHLSSSWFLISHLKGCEVNKKFTSDAEFRRQEKQTDLNFEKLKWIFPSASPKVEVLFSFFGLHFWHLQLLLKQSETPF